MPKEKDLDSEIPDFVKKYVPGVSRGLSWANYSSEKAKGTAVKSEAFNESKAEGYAAALNLPSGSNKENIRDNTLKEIWSLAEELTEDVRKVSSQINSQVSREKREEVLSEARILARKAGVQAAIAAGWEQGWNEGIAERYAKESD